MRYQEDLGNSGRLGHPYEVGWGLGPASQFPALISPPRLQRPGGAALPCRGNSLN